MGIQGGTFNHCPVHQEHPPSNLTRSYQHLNAEEEKGEEEEEEEEELVS